MRDALISKLMYYIYFFELVASLIQSFHRLGQKLLLRYFLVVLSVLPLLPLLLLLPPALVLPLLLQILCASDD